MYADDTLVDNVINSIYDCIHAALECTPTGKVSIWQMQFNPSKSQVLISIILYYDKTLFAWELSNLLLSMLVQCGHPILLKTSTKLKLFKVELLDLYASSYYYSISISNMLKSLGWPTLQRRRHYLKLLLTYKIYEAMISVPSDNFKPVTVTTRGYQSHFQCLKTTCDSYSFSFFPSAIRMWSCLPTDIASISCFNEFNMKLQQYLFIDNI